MKKILIGALAALYTIVASATTYTPVQLLNPAGSSAGQMIVSGGGSNSPTWSNAPTITGGTISGLSAPIPFASGGTNAITALGATAALQYQGSGTGVVSRSVASKLGDVVSALDYQGVSCNGSNDDTSGIQNAITQNPGKVIRFPYTGSACIINTALAQSTPPVSFIVDSGVTFGGSVAALPAAFTNPQQVNVGNYFVQQPGYANTNGASPLQLESLPTSTFTGNAVTLYAGIRSPLGGGPFSGNLWAANFLTTLSASTGTYNGQGIEIDLNNHYKNSAGYGQLITGLGEFHSTAAISVDRGDTTSDWQTGIWVKKFQTYGINIDASTSQSPRYGLSIGGMDSGHIRITPKDASNPTATVFAIQDYTGLVNQFTIAANGNFNGGAATVTGATINGSLAVTGTVSGTGFSNYLASPPAIGGTAAAAGTFTNLTATGTVTGITGRLLGVQVFSASGTYTPTTGTGRAIVDCVGAGGGGGGTAATSTGQSAIGQAGSSGSYARIYWTSPSSQTVTIGAAGTASSGAAGGNGGTSSVGSVVSCPGGVGGTAGSAGSNSSAFTVGAAAQASAPTVSGATTVISSTGNQGSYALVLNANYALNGQGGPSPLTGGGGQISGGRGAGGAGGIAGASSAATAGTAGAAGEVIVYEYQ